MKKLVKECLKESTNESRVSAINKNKITKRILLNRLMNILMELDEAGKIEDIGEKSTNPHIHEFMIDGYLFEIRLVDDL